MEKNKDDAAINQLLNDYLSEYNTLRSEIIKRIDIRNSIVFGTLTFAGVLLSFGLEIPTLAIIYTIISMFLAAAWVQSDVIISKIGRYIRENIETSVNGLNWETFRQKTRLEEMEGTGIRPSVVFSTSGIFILTQTIAMMIAFSKIGSFTVLDWILGAIALVSELLTIYFFWIAYRQDAQTK